MHLSADRTFFTFFTLIMNRKGSVCLSYREYLYQIEAQVKDRMGKEAQICIHSVVKNNSIVLDGLSILEQGDNVSPAIYLNGFYQ